MNITLLSTLRKSVLAATVAVAGLALGAQAVPAAHASVLVGPPTITTSVTQTSIASLNLNVEGIHFTPAGQVRVLVYDRNLHIVTTRIVTASPRLCNHLFCLGGGAIATHILFVSFFPHPHGTVYVIAYDVASHHWSNWSKAALPPLW